MEDGTPFGPGREVGHYRIVAKLGAGGMGEVYRATDSRLGRDVAIKVLPDKVVKDPDRLARFEREARLLASLSHPAIGAIHGVDEHGGRPFLVLELVPGEDLSERLARGPLDVPAALAVAIQVAQALEEAHGKGIVHRDLKPANVKVSPKGRVKVLDFGLATVSRGDSGGLSPEELSQLPTQQQPTSDGVVLGTAAYMSPEQARGQAVDKRTDIWAFGVVLFEMLTGRRLFARPALSDTLAALLEREVDWRALPEATPAVVRHVLRRCLEKDRERRLHDIADARLELEDAAHAPPPSPSTAEPPRRPPLAWMALSAGLALALAVALLPSRGGDSGEEHVTRTHIPLPRTGRGPVTGLQLAISPDGRFVAYTDGQLYLRRLDELSPAAVTGTVGAYSPFFSADSRWLGFMSSDGSTRRVSVGGGAPTTLLERADPAGATWCPDGTIVGAEGTTVGGLSERRPDGSPSTALIDPDIDQGQYSFLFPRILPDNDAILVTIAHARMDSWAEAWVAVFRRSTRQLSIVLEGGSRARYSPSGHLVFMQGSTLLAAPFDLDGLQMTGAPVPILEGVLEAADTGGGFDISMDGTLLYAPGGAWREPSRMVLVDRQGRELRVLSEDQGAHHPRFSPDGGRIAYAAGPVTPDIRVLDLARGAETAVTTSWLQGWLRWTADGQYLEFGSNRTGRWNKHRRRADASDAMVPVLVTDHLATRAAIVGGIALTEEAPLGRSWDLMLRSGEDSSVLGSFLATPANEQSPQLSPDQEWVVYESDETGRFEVYLRPFPKAEGQWPVSIGGGRFPRWNGSGREVFYLDGSRVMVVDVRLEGGSPHLGQPRLLFERRISESWLGNNYDVAPDGQTFVIIEERDPTPPPDHLVLVQDFDEELKRLVPSGAR